MKIKLNAIELAYTKTGSGPPLLLLHGNGETRQIFSKLMLSLNQSYTVYAIDSRNHGESSQTTDYHYMTMMTDILCFIEALDLTTPSVVGFSDGAIIALLLAVHQPNQLKKMALLGVNLSPADFKPEVYQEILQEYQTSPTPLLKLMLEEPAISLEDVEQLTLPTLVIAGENDGCPSAFFEKLKKHLQNGQLLILAGHDHSSYIIDNDLLAEPLLAFFAK